MKSKHYFTLFFLLFTFACNDHDGDPKKESANPWKEKTAFPGDYLAGSVSFVIDTTLFVGTGIHDAITNTFYKYQHQNDTWKQISFLPASSRHHGIAFVIGDYGYVGLGSNLSSYFNDLWRYDPTDDTWEKMSDFPGDPRANAVSFVIGEKAYVTGGSSYDHNDMWEYTPATDSWAEKKSYPGKCFSRGISFSVKEKGYVGFGWKDGSCKDLWEYDPLADEWTEKSSFPAEPRYGGVGLANNDHGIVGFGVSQDLVPSTIEYLTDLWQFDVSNNTWTKIETNYPGKGRVEMIKGVIENKIIFGLGAMQSSHGPFDRCSDIWEYTISD